MYIYIYISYVCIYIDTHIHIYIYKFTSIPYLPKCWSHWHVSLGNSPKIKI